MMTALNGWVGRHRVGVRFAEASVASRSEANTNAMRAILTLPVLPFRKQMSPGISKPSCISGWAYSTWVRLQQLANQKIRKINRTFPSAHIFEPHWIADECLAHKTLAPVPFDLPIASHTAHSQAAGITQQHPPRSQPFRMINLLWRSLSQPLVRTDLVVGFYPTVGTPLLRSQVTRRGSRRLRLQHPMHLLVRSVLLGMPRGDEFDSNPQSRPPSAQARKPRRTSRSEGRSIVHADDIRISLLPKQAQENPPDWSPTLILQHADCQQISTEQIPHRQRFHSLAILSPKPTFEIHRPYLIASRSRRQHFAAQLRSSPRPAAAATIQLHSLEPLANRPRSRGPLTRIFFAQSSGKLPAAPTPMPSAQPANPAQPLWRSSPRRTVWTTRPISQSARSLQFESSLPFVAALATESEQPTQLRHALLGLGSQLRKLQPAHPRGHFFPRHVHE